MYLNHKFRCAENISLFSYNTWFLSKTSRSSCHGAVETNQTRNHEVARSIPGIARWVKDLALPSAVVYVGHRLGSDLTWLWLWHRLAATAPTGPLAWEPPYVMGAARKSKKKKEKKKKASIPSGVLLNQGILRKQKSRRGFNMGNRMFITLWKGLGEQRSEKTTTNLRQ